VSYLRCNCKTQKTPLWVEAFERWRGDRTIAGSQQHAARRRGTSAIGEAWGWRLGGLESWSGVVACWGRQQQTR
jgi:hypothetical protein